MIRLFFFIFLSQFVYAQIFWTASGESGYYNSSGNLLQSEEEILTRINLKAGYNYQADKHTGQISFQLRPEIYGFENKLQTTQIGFDGFYSQGSKDFDWTVRLAVNQYIFSGNITDFSYDSFILSGQVVLPLYSKISIDTKAGIAYRNFDHRNAISLDILFSEIDLIYTYNSFTKIYSGLYLEKFQLHKETSTYFTFENTKNDGIRIGPAFKFNFTRKFVLSVNYQFLIHDSEYTTYPSFDQWLRLIAGTNIIKNLSAFVLVDYYKRNFKYLNNGNITQLLYSPVNAENRVFFRLSNKIKTNMKTFLQIGYFEEKLFYKNYSLSGWKVYIGFEING